MWPVLVTRPRPAGCEASPVRGSNGRRRLGKAIVAAVGFYVADILQLPWDFVDRLSADWGASGRTRWAGRSRGAATRRGRVEPPASPARAPHGRKRAGLRQGFPETCPYDILSNTVHDAQVQRPEGVTTPDCCWDFHSRPVEGDVWDWHDEFALRRVH